MIKKLLITGLFLTGFLYAFSGEDAQNTKTAVQEVIKTFKAQVRMPVVKTIIKIPYNINYSITINHKNYFVSEYKIKIIFKTVATKSLYSSEKNYIIRFIVDADRDIVVKEEIYTLTNEKVFDKTIK